MGSPTAFLLSILQEKAIKQHFLFTICDMEKHAFPSDVNPAAESILEKFLNAILIIFIIIGAIGAFASIIVASIESDRVFLWGIPIAILFVTVAGVFWAIGKVLINISRNLYNINDALRSGAVPIVGKMIDSEVKPAPDGAAERMLRETKNHDGIEEKAANKAVLEKIDGEKFVAGQLVIIKADERQVRVSTVFRKEDGTMTYYSDRHNKFFDENELEDFDKYWAARKK